MALQNFAIFFWQEFAILVALLGCVDVLHLFCFFDHVHVRQRRLLLLPPTTGQGAQDDDGGGGGGGEEGLFPLGLPVLQGEVIEISGCVKMLSDSDPERI